MRQARQRRTSDAAFIILMILSIAYVSVCDVLETQAAVDRQQRQDYLVTSGSERPYSAMCTSVQWHGSLVTLSEVIL